MFEATPAPEDKPETGEEPGVSEEPEDLAAYEPGSLAAAFLNGFLDGVYTFPR